MISSNQGWFFFFYLCGRLLAEILTPGAHGESRELMSHASNQPQHLFLEPWQTIHFLPRSEPCFLLPSTHLLSGYFVVVFLIALLSRTVDTGSCLNFYCLRKLYRLGNASPCPSLPFLLSVTFVASEVSKASCLFQIACSFDLQNWFVDEQTFQVLIAKLSSLYWSWTMYDHTGGNCFNKH